MALVICGFFPFLGAIASGMKAVLAKKEASDRGAGGGEEGPGRGRGRDFYFLKHTS